MKQEKWREVLNEELNNCDASSDIARTVQNVRFSLGSGLRLQASEMTP